MARGKGDCQCRPTETRRLHIDGLSLTLMSHDSASLGFHMRADCISTSQGRRRQPLSLVRRDAV